MKLDKLILESKFDGKTYIYWFLEEFDDIGSALGDDLNVIAEARGGPKDGSTDDEYAEHQDYLLANQTAAKLAVYRDTAGFFWYSETAARKAMGTINATRKAAQAEKPWPEWAVQAVAAGWKAPKGWRP